MRLSLGQVTFHLFLRQLIDTAIHEISHLVGARIIGIYAEVRSTRLNAAYPKIREILGRNLNWGEHVIFYGSGGWITALAWIGLDFGNIDPDTRVINRWCAIQSFIYGCFEAFAPRSWWEPGAMVALLVALWIPIIFVIRKKPELVLF